MIVFWDGNRVFVNLHSLSCYVLSWKAAVASANFNCWDLKLNLNSISCFRASTFQVLPASSYRSMHARASSVIIWTLVHNSFESDSVRFKAFPLMSSSFFEHCDHWVLVYNWLMPCIKCGWHLLKCLVSMMISESVIPYKWYNMFMRWMRTGVSHVFLGYTSLFLLSPLHMRISAWICLLVEFRSSSLNLSGHPLRIF